VSHAVSHAPGCIPRKSPLGVTDEREPVHELAVDDYLRTGPRVLAAPPVVQPAG
jgi:hypothetical protein